VDPAHLLYPNTDFTLDVGGIITGRVTAAATGLPIPGVPVYANEYDTGWTGQGAMSDPTGAYTITGLAAADYRVAVDDASRIPDGYAFEFYPDTRQHDQAARIPVALNSVTPGIDFALEPGSIITGHVTDEATGLPVPFMKVEVHSQNGPWGWGVCTDANGDYWHRALPFGEYKISAAGDWNWCQNQPSAYVREYFDNTPFWQDAAVLTLDAAPIPNIHFTLEPGGYLVGQVTDAGGLPVAGLRMEAVLPSPDCPWCYDHLLNADTDAAGVYRLGPLPAVPLGVHACTDCTGQLLVGEFYDDVYDPQAMTLLTVTNGITLTGIDFVLDPGIWITGHVTVPPGYSSAGLAVNAWKTDGIWFGTDRRTDAAGSYVLPVPPIYDSLWGVQVRAEGTDLAYRWAHQFDLAQHTSWDFALDVGGVITGCITDGGAPLPGLWMTANSGEMHNGAHTDDRGCYAIANLPPADYDIRQDDWASGRMWTNYGGLDWGWQTTIPLGPADRVTGIDFEVPLRGQIEGYVYESDGVTPIEGVRVTAINADSFWEGYSQPDGYVTIDVPVGSHRLLFERGFWEVIPAYYPDSSIHTYAAATPLAVTALPTTTFFTMALERPSTLTGQVTDAASGVPLGGIHVVLANTDPAVDRDINAWGSCTDEFGHYHIHPAWPGQSVVMAIGTCGNWDYGLVTTTVTAQPGMTHTVNLQMHAGTMPPRPFTIRTNDSYDYTPLAAGHNLIRWDADNILPALFEPLVSLQPDGAFASGLLQQVPTLANGGAAIVNDRLVVTYTLKPGLLWSDGQPLTSADVRFTWQMLAQPHPYTDGQAQYELAARIDDVATPDPLTAVLTYQIRAFPPAYPLAITYLLPAHILAGQHPVDVRWNSYAHNPVGNGPYVVVDWVPGSHLDLTANPNYHRANLGYPIIRDVRLLFTHSQFWSLVNGVADVSTDATWELPPFYQDFDFAYHEIDDSAFYAIYPNLDRPFFAETAVRQALYH
ncbi:MAG: carboxypeptidase regulatory-like domain-containing protein, partial [Anaerolineales bacterium]|nr:carboxypeptidase regulatory-like domain-containing protein [Anaerolineales bacterium]